MRLSVLTFLWGLFLATAGFGASPSPLPAALSNPPLPPLGLVATLAQLKADSEGLAFIVTNDSQAQKKPQMLKFLEAYSRQKSLTDQLVFQLIADNYQASKLFKRLRSYKKLNTLLATTTLDKVAPVATPTSPVEKYTAFLKQIYDASQDLQRLKEPLLPSAKVSKIDIQSVIALPIDPVSAAVALAGLYKDLSDLKAARITSLNTVLDGLRLVALRDAVKSK